MDRFSDLSKRDAENSEDWPFHRLQIPNTFRKPAGCHGNPMVKSSFI